MYKIFRDMYTNGGNGNGPGEVYSVQTSCN